jgi:putative membrane protein
LTTIETSIRNLTRSFLACSHVTGKRPSEEERADTEQAVRLLLALIYAAKNHLRAEWGMNNVIPLLLPKSAGDVERRHRRESTSVHQPEYEDLLPSGIRGFEDQGLGLLLQLSIRIESYIKRGEDRKWFSSPQAGQLSQQLNLLTAAYGSMETIHLTPLPVTYLIHLKQVLALFIGVLPFALVEEMGWYTVLMVSLVCFTLYGWFSHNNDGNNPFGC